LVWSDKKIAKLSREFVTVADEAYTLYPEHQGNLDRVKDDPAHRFFKRFGESMPDADWPESGTRQGIYMMGPDGEYLEGQFAVSGPAKEVLRRMERALEQWQRIRKEKRYKNKPVPEVVTVAPPEVAGGAFVLRVHSRDLPRSGGESCERFDASKHRGRDYLGYIKWAWNENWLSLADGAKLVPPGKKERPVDEEVARQIVRHALVDNVRGQAGVWSGSAIRSLRLTMQAGPTKNSMKKIIYRGEVELQDGGLFFRGRIYGEGYFHIRRRKIERFEMVALGERGGAYPANRRHDDLGPAPIGFALTLVSQ
jgi:hypothetical protein